MQPFVTTPSARAAVGSEWRDELVFTRDLTEPHALAAFVREVRKGNYLALFRGAYVDVERWNATSLDGQYRCRVIAAALSVSKETIFSHDSAAALWRLPRVGPAPTRVHVLHEEASGGRSNMTVTRHVVGLPSEFELIDGIRVTTLARTVVDLAVANPFAVAVAAADASLRRTDHPQAGLPVSRLVVLDLEAELTRIPLSHGRRKAARVIAFADGSADRPGESISRVNMSIAGLTSPKLQEPLRGASGREYEVDFWWPEIRLIGEFDGKFKYTDEAYRQGRTPAQVVYDEKLREDDLRAAGYRVSRWNWEIAMSPTRLRDHLMAAGVTRAWR